MGFLKINWYIFYKSSPCNTVFYFAWPGVEGTAEFFNLSLERSQQMLRVMLHKGNSYKFASLFQQYIFDEINFCKNLFCVNTDQTETFQVVKKLSCSAQTPDLHDRQSYKCDWKKINLYLSLKSTFFTGGILAVI